MVIDEYLAYEVLLGRVAGPFCTPPLASLHISSFAVTVELDSLVQVARLLVGKFVAVKSLVQSWSSRQWCTRWEIESLIPRQFGQAEPFCAI